MRETEKERVRVKGLNHCSNPKDFNYIQLDNLRETSKTERQSNGAGVKKKKSPRAERLTSQNITNSPERK